MQKDEMSSATKNRQRSHSREASSRAEEIDIALLRSEIDLFEIDPYRESNKQMKDLLNVKDASYCDLLLSD